MAIVINMDPRNPILITMAPHLMFPVYGIGCKGLCFLLKLLRVKFGMLPAEGFEALSCIEG